MTDAPPSTEAEAAPETSEENDRAAPAAATTPKGKKFTPGRGAHGAKLWPRDWLEIYQMVRNGVPVWKVAKTYGIQKSTVYRKLKSQNIRVKGYTPSNNQAERDKEREALLKKIRETKERDYTFTDFLQREMVGLVTEAKKTGSRVGVIAEDIKALKTAIEGIRIGTANKWRILGLDKENAEADQTLPELPIRDLTPAEMMAMRDRQAIEDLDDDALERLDLEPDPEDDVEVEGPPADLEDEDEA